VLGHELNLWDDTTDTHKVNEYAAFSILATNQIIVIPYSAQETNFAHTCATTLRAAGLIVEQALPPFDLKKQLTSAVKRGATWAAIIFPDEAALGKIALKNLITGTQESLDLNDARNTITAS
jgi:histidyl-tRNA synthetase